MLPWRTDSSESTRTPSERPRPALELPRPRASSAPPSSHPAKRMALNYLPVTEEITPPIIPPRAQAKEIDTATETVPETPSPIQKPGRSRGRGTWRAPQKIAPGVGTRSKTRLANSRNAPASYELKAYWIGRKSLFLDENNILWRNRSDAGSRAQLVVPRSLRDTIFNDSHHTTYGGHFGITHTHS